MPVIIPMMSVMMRLITTDLMTILQNQWDDVAWLGDTLGFQLLVECFDPFTARGLC